jgi:hypothetical protein
MKWLKILVKGCVILIILVLIAVVYDCKDVKKYIHNKNKYSEKVFEGNNGVPKGYKIQFNEITNQYRWCTDSWFGYCSPIYHTTKEETIKWINAYQKHLDSENEYKWATIK